MRPSFSVITPLLNRADMLGEALASAAGQGAIEHIVVDGGSTDGSLEIARAAPGVTTIDAPRSSIYEAINIGIAHAQGEVLCLLNSDDRMERGAIAAAAALFASDPSLELARGRAAFERKEAGAWRVVEDGAKAAAELNLRAVLLDRPNINACFFRRSLIERMGGFNTAYPISADREWLARALLAGARTASLDAVVYTYRNHAGSLTIGGGKAAEARWLAEHLDFAAKLLRQKGLTTDERAALNAFQGKEIAHLAALSAARGDVGGALGAVFDGFRSNPSWPLHAAGPVAAILARRLGVR